MCDSGAKEQTVYYACSDDLERLEATEPDEAIRDALETMDNPLPRTLVLIGYARDDFSEHDAECEAQCAVESLIERLDEEHGDPDDATTITDKMLEAARTFVRAVLAEYTVWSCHEISREPVDVLDWITNNEPSWLQGPNAVVISEVD